MLGGGRENGRVIPIEEPTSMIEVPPRPLPRGEVEREEVEPPAPAVFPAHAGRDRNPAYWVFA